MAFEWFDSYYAISALAFALNPTTSFIPDGNATSTKSTILTASKRSTSETAIITYVLVLRRATTRERQRNRIRTLRLPYLSSPQPDLLTDLLLARRSLCLFPAAMATAIECLFTPSMKKVGLVSKKESKPTAPVLLIR